jgi:hypothetical protein
MTDEKFALITGASSGLGSEFARQLAGGGYRLILTARRKERLEQLAAELENQYPVSTEIISADLSEPEGQQTVAEHIRSLPRLDLLVNNAGFGTNGAFFEVEGHKNAAMVEVHVNASVLLTHAALPGMIQRGQGTIINVSSVAGLIPIRSVLYASTKAFLVIFSEVLQAELRGTGVKVQALCPGFTHTEFHETPEYTGFERRKIPRPLWLTSEQVVRESIAHLKRKSVVCIPGFQYKIISVIGRNSLSGPIVRQIGTRMFRK